MSRRDRAHSLSALLGGSAALVALIAVVAVAADRWRTKPPPVAPQVPPLLVHEADGLRFTYHVPTGTEALYDLGTDPRGLRNLCPARPEDARRLRAALEKKLGVPDLGDLRESRRRQIEDLEALGYL